jgi:molybdopterin-binding protein
MKIRPILAASVAIVSLAVSPTVYAAPANLNVPVHAIFVKTRMITMSVRNDSKNPIELKVGEQVMTVAPGKSLSVHVAVGTRILANAPSGNYQTGDVLADVTADMSDTTLALR